MAAKWKQILITLLCCGPMMGYGKAISGVSLSFQGVNSQNGFIIPIRIVDGLIIIQATVNDQTGNLILDTGAKTLVLNESYFHTYQKTNNPAAGLGGEIESVGYLPKVNLETDLLKISNLQADVIPMSVIETKKQITVLGLLGYEVLKSFEIMLNYRESYITLSRVDENGEVIDALPHTRHKVDSMAFEMGNFIPVLNVKINGIPKRMGLDTGAEVNLLDIKKNKDILDNYQITNKIKINGTDNRNFEALAGRLYRVQLFGKYTCGGMATVLTNLDNFEAIYNTRLDGIVGYEMLSPWIFSINYRKKMLYLHHFKSEKP